MGSRVIPVGGSAWWLKLWLANGSGEPLAREGVRPLCRGQAVERADRGHLSARGLCDRLVLGPKTLESPCSSGIEMPDLEH